MTIDPALDTGRRRFLQGSAAAISGAALIPALSRTVHAGADETIKIGLVGCGGRGTGALSQALNTEGPVKLWAVGDLFQDQIDKSLTSLTGGPGGRGNQARNSRVAGRVDVSPDRRFVGFDAYKQVIDSGIDMVILATNPHFRSIQFEYAVKQGKHAFMEKPLAVDAVGVRRVLAAAKAAKTKGLKVGVGMQRHHNNVYTNLVPRIQEGLVGDINYLRCYWVMGYLWKKDRQPNQSEMAYQIANWNYFTWLSGDHIVEQHCHNIDVCNWIMQGHPESARGMGGRQVRVEPEYGQIFDHHFVEYTYSNGVKLFSQCRQTRNCWNSVTEHVHGTKGTVELSSGGGKVAGGISEKIKKGENPYQVEHDDLFRAIRNDLYHNEAEYGATSTLTAIMGRMATYSGQELTWDQALNSQLSLAPERYDLGADPPVMPNEDGSYPIAVPGVSKAF